MKVLLVLGFASQCLAQHTAALLTPVWVQFGDRGRVLARVVVDTVADCPTVRLDTGIVPMAARIPVPANMKPVCEAVIPEEARSGSVNGQTLALPRPNPSRVIVVGDTGCRIKGKRIQDCNDPAKWPLQRVSIRAAAEKPDLIVHVGDYLYREDDCPADLTHLCGTDASGDRWNTWNADFFAPAAKLLTAGPWAFSRGNHEDCSRAWKGWFYYLDPGPWSDRVCESYSAPYLVQLGSLQLFMLDSSAATEKNPSEKQIGIYTAQLRAIHAGNVWIVDHHPFWAMKPAAEGELAQQLTAPLAEAWKRAKPQRVSMVVSGHTHLFELLSFGPDRPPQLVAGDGGTNLAEALPGSMQGDVHGAAIVTGASRHAFGYTLLRKVPGGWNLDLKAPVEGTVVTCTIRGNATDCERELAPKRN